MLVRASVIFGAIRAVRIVHAKNMTRGSKIRLMREKDSLLNEGVHTEATSTTASRICEEAMEINASETHPASPINAVFSALLSKEDGRYVRILSSIELP